MGRLYVARDSLDGCRLLLAEDSTAVALSLIFFLESYGCCVSRAARRDQTIALIETQTFDIALLDITLADGSVYPVAQALFTRSIPFMFLTGFSAQHLPQAWRNWTVLEKTVDPTTIAQRLTTLYQDKKRQERLPSDHETIKR